MFTSSAKVLYRRFLDYSPAPTGAMMQLSLSTEISLYIKKNHLCASASKKIPLGVPQHIRAGVLHATTRDGLRAGELRYSFACRITSPPPSPSAVNGGKSLATKNLKSPDPVRLQGEVLFCSCSLSCSARASGGTLRKRRCPCWFLTIKPSSP